MKMLLAVDLQSEPERVVADATEWIVRLGAVVDVVYVDELHGLQMYVGNDHLRPMLQPEWDRLIAEDHAALARLLALLPAANRGQGLLADGQAAPTLAEKGAAYDVVALGTRGRTGLAHLWMGSVAESVVRRATRPVLVVRPAALAQAPRVLVALDLKGPARQTIDRAAPWIEQLGATADLLYVDEARLPLAAVRDPVVQIGLESQLAIARGQHLEALALLAERIPHDRRGRVFVDEGEPVAAILGRVDEYDLLVTGAHSREGLALAVLGSVAERVLRRSPRPVLAVR